MMPNRLKEYSISFSCPIAAACAGREYTRLKAAVGYWRTIRSGIPSGRLHLSGEDSQRANTVENFYQEAAPGAFCSR